jgi:PAS domain-containing protein
MEKTSRSTSFLSLALWISSGRGVLYANTSFCQYFGFPIEQIVGDELGDLAALTSG